MEAKKRLQDRFEKIFEEFSKELKNILREYLGEKRSVEKESFDFEVKIREREREVGKVKQENEEVEVEIPKEQCSASVEGKLQEEFGDVSPKKVPYNFVPSMRLWHQVDIIPGAPILTRPTFQTHEEVPPKETEDEAQNDSSGPNESDVNKAEYYKGVDTISKLCKDDYVLECQEKGYQTNHSTGLAKSSSAGVICGAFVRFIFDPGGIRAINSWSDSLEEGGNDVKQG